MTRAGRTFLRLIIAPIALLFTAAAHDAAAALRSPWDVPALGRAFGEPCPAAPALPALSDVRDYYSDAAHSVVDATRRTAYDRAMRPWRNAVRRLDDMADRYRTEGDGTLAACSARWLAGFARQGVLTEAMHTNQAVYVQGWMLGSLAIAWLKIRAEAITTAERSAVASWLADVAAANRRYYADRAAKTDGRNNHRYWAGLAVMAAGIAADRQDLYDWGVASFRIGAAQISADGTLPLEMERRALALHYHLFAAAPLVTIAELASANGLDLYADNDGALPRLVRTAVAGIADPTFFARHAGAAQQPIKLTADDIAWTAPFARRFPDPTLAALLARAPSHSMAYIGGLPPP